MSGRLGDDAMAQAHPNDGSPGFHIRPIAPGELKDVVRLTLEGFDGLAIEYHVEQRFGTFGGHDWRDRKAREVEREVEANPQGCLVAEQGGRVVGYVTTLVDPWSRKGRIPNLAVDREARGAGLGRCLLEAALAYFRAQGMEFVMIETLRTNPVGMHLYPSVGFTEVAQQVHFALRLAPQASPSSIFEISDAQNGIP